MIGSTILGFTLMAGCLVFELCQRIHLLSLQRQCLEYNSPPDQMAFDERADSVPILVRSDPVFVQGLTAPTSGVPFIGRIPAEWRAYSNLVSSSNLHSMGTAFLHRRRSPLGHERCVAIDIQKRRYAPSVDWHARVFSIGTIGRTPAEITSSLPFHDYEGLKFYGIEDPPHEWAVAAGECDATQLDHFTIRIYASGQQGIIHGYLRDDDQITLEWPRSWSTPSAPPSPASSRSTDQFPPPAPLPAGR